MTGKSDNPIDKRQEDWPKCLYCRDGSFRYKRTVDGRKYSEVFGKISYDEAVRRAKRFDFDIEDGKDPTTKKETRSRTFQYFAEVWLKQKKGDIRDKSYARYRAVTDNFIYYLETVCGKANCPLTEITYATATDYITCRRNSPLMPNGSRKFTRAIKEGASKATLHYEKETLHRIFNEAIRRKLIDENPFDNVKADKPSRKERATKRHPLDLNEQLALEQASVTIQSPETDDAKFSDIVHFLLRTGERENEMVHLEWTDIEWSLNVIHVREKMVTEVRRVPIPSNAIPILRKLIANRVSDERLFDSEEVLVSSGLHLDIRAKKDLLNIKIGEVDLEKKSIITSITFKWSPKGSEGDIPMCKSVRQLLRRLQITRTSNFVFAHHDGGKCRLRLLDMLKKAQKLAGIKGRLRVHDTRHSFGFTLRDQGKPLEAIMGLMRHADIRETLEYAPYREEEGRKAIECFDAIDESAKSAEGKKRENLAGKQGHLAGIERDENL